MRPSFHCTIHSILPHPFLGIKLDWRRCCERQYRISTIPVPTVLFHKLKGIPECKHRPIVVDSFKKTINHGWGHHIFGGFRGASSRVKIAKRQQSKTWWAPVHTTKTQKSRPNILYTCRALETYEGCQGRILECVINLVDDSTCFFQSSQDCILSLPWVGPTTHHGRGLTN